VIYGTKLITSHSQFSPNHVEEGDIIKISLVVEILELQLHSVIFVPTTPSPIEGKLADFSRDSPMDLETESVMDMDMVICHLGHCHHISPSTKRTEFTFAPCALLPHCKISSVLQKCGICSQDFIPFLVTAGSPPRDHGLVIVI
jgi:hypothetical protein